MTIQSDLRTATNRIVTARTALAQAELSRLSRRADVANAEANLTHARTYLMAQPEAGANDHQRRAYTVQSLDGRNAYAVTRNRHGVWRCDCPAYRHRPITGVVGGPLCKHIIAAQQVAEPTRPRPVLVGTGPNGRYTIDDFNRDVF
jgi:hypothetical protein